MRAELTKTFAFSACHTVAGKVLGRNYLLGISVEWEAETPEKKLSDVVHREIISKVHTRDLDENVDFLGKTAVLDDVSLLKAFWGRLSGPLSEFRVHKLTLQRDSQTSTAYWPDVSK